MSYKEAPPELDQRFHELVAALSNKPSDQTRQSSAADLAYSIRSRCIDLATWKADFSPEYTMRVIQATQLTSLAGQYADEVLFREFWRPDA